MTRCDGRRWAIAALAALGLATATAAGAAASEQRAGLIQLEVAGGVNGWYDAGDHVVVAASITSDETINGEIQVVLPFANTSVTREVQVAGSTTKQVLLVVPTGFDQGNAEVQLHIGDEIVAKKQLRLNSSTTVEIVGILPALAIRLGDVPAQVPLASDLGRAEVAAIPEEYLTLGPAALDVYDTIIGVGGDLTSLDANGRANLLSWINHGGRLLLDDSAGLDVLPGEWRPGPANYAWAGRGEVRLVDGQASAGRLGELIEPTSSSAEQPGGFFGPVEGIGAPVQQDLAERAGVKLPSLTPILVGMLIYVVVVGPLLYFGLRVWRRLTLGWVLVPVLALVTGGVVVVAGSDFRDSGKPAMVVFADGYPGGSEDQLAVLTFRRSGGSSRVGFPAGWQVSTSVFGFSDTSIAHTFSAGAEGSTFRARLEPGQVTDATFVGQGTETGIDVDAHIDDNDIVGTVTNTTTGTLYDVAVFSAGDSQLIGTLAAGESKSYEMVAKPLQQVFGLAQNVWSRPDQGFGFGERSDKAEFAIWALASERLALYPTGLVRAAGWTDERPTPANAGSEVVTRSVITSTAPITQEGGPLNEGAVRTVQVRPPFDQFGGGNGDSAIRYLLPPNFDGQQLLVTAAVGMDGVEFWDGEQWLEVEVDDRKVLVPQEAVRAGVVLMRIEVGANFRFDPNQVLFIRGATSEDLS